MANAAVKIYNHTKDSAGKWVFSPVDISLDTRSTKAVPGNFKLSWYEGAKKRFSLGHFRYLSEAIAAGRRKRDELQNGVTTVPTKGPDSLRWTTPRTSIEEAVAAYLKRVKLNGRPGTYALAESDLQEWVGWNNNHPKRVRIEDVTKDDMLEYRNWCVQTKRAPRTAVNKVMRINHFICQTLCLKPGLGPIKQVEAEKIIVRSAANDVEYYSEEELNRYFTECDPRQHLLFSTFLMSGCRRQEIEFLYWDDLDFTDGTLHVSAKPEWDFTVKTKEERFVPLPEPLVARLKEYKKTAHHRLVFPTSTGGPLGNSLLVACKRVAKRAGLNCGTCKTCIERKECEHWFLHKFRATFATRMLQAGMDVATLQEILGHSDLSSTMRYLGNLKKKALRDKVNGVWAAVGAK